MKKNKNRIVVLCMLVTMMFSLTACGEAADKKAVEQGDEAAKQVEQVFEEQGIKTLTEAVSGAPEAFEYHSVKIENSELADAGYKEEYNAIYVFDTAEEAEENGKAYGDYLQENGFTAQKEEQGAEAVLDEDGGVTDSKSKVINRDATTFWNENENMFVGVDDVVGLVKWEGAEGKYGFGIHIIMK